MSRLIDLAGKRFGRLVVIERGGDLAPKIPGWLCKCECGNEVLLNGSNLRRGLTSSCGCLRREVTISRFTTHGKTAGGLRAPEFYIWNMMIQRCENPKTKIYHRYGGRGIKVCDRWHKFPNFLEDMKDRPSPKHTLERIDNDEDYTPVNCVWATKTRQANNRRTNRKIKFGNRLMTLRQIMEETNCEIAFNTVRARVFFYGWSIEDALSRPLSRR